MGHMYWLKAQLHAKKEDYKSAMKSIEKMKALKGNYLFYYTQKDALKMDEQTPFHRTFSPLWLECPQSPCKNWRFHTFRTR
ncbi:MAG: hypothetical protein RIC35_01820 [Marinoscillum sp.]